MEFGTVTVLLPVHNGGSHLKEAVSSILCQTWHELHLLVIDDGSTDGSGEWLDSLDDPRVRVIHQPNRGLVAALNRGLAEATTEFVARMDADDVASPQRIERQARFLASHPGTVAVGSCYQVADEGGRPLETVHVAGAPEYLRRRLYFRNTFAHTSMMFRRSEVVRVGGYREVGPVEDYDLWIRLSADHELGALPEVLVTYRRTSDGISAAQREHQLASLNTVRRQLHEARPLEVVSARQIYLEGRQHHRRFATSCDDALSTYVYDHAWLAILSLRRRRFSPAGRLIIGVARLLARHPGGFRGLPLVAEFLARRSGRRQ